MNDEKKARIIRVMHEIAADVEKDAKEIDGQPFNGHTVATFMGRQAAAVQAIANAIAAILDEPAHVGGER